MVRTLHRRLGISIACFLFAQVVAGMLMSAGRLASVEMSPPYNVLYFIHADWDPLGSIYRIVLGLATVLQGVLGKLHFPCHEKAQRMLPVKGSDRRVDHF